MKMAGVGRERQLANICSIAAKRYCARRCKGEENLSKAQRLNRSVPKNCICPSFLKCDLCAQQIVFCQFALLLLNATQVGDRVATVRATDLDSGEFIYIYGAIYIYGVVAQSHGNVVDKSLSILKFWQTNLAAEFIGCFQGSLVG